MFFDVFAQNIPVISFPPLLSRLCRHSPHRPRLLLSIPPYCQVQIQKYKLRLKIRTLAEAPPKALRSPSLPSRPYGALLLSLFLIIFALHLLHCIVLTGFPMYSKEEKKQLKTDFWNGFAAYCAAQRGSLRRESPFMLYNTRMKGVELKFDVRRDSVDVVLEANGCNRAEMYGRISAYKVLFDEAFAAFTQSRADGACVSQVIYAPDYERESGEMVSRIYVTCGGLDFHRREDWPKFYDFMYTRMTALERVFRDVREACSESL